MLFPETRFDIGNAGLSSLTGQFSQGIALIEDDKALKFHYATKRRMRHQHLLVTHAPQNSIGFLACNQRRKRLPAAR
ncbi:MAG: hypothetical protein BVN31_03050 [Proteobacteria bacterium ST_bin15]|nr:MAG: hypothetical protein BVN31_03050 [Proteobacteria bacterium ST_bin15]